MAYKDCETDAHLWSERVSCDDPLKGRRDDTYWSEWRGVVFLGCEHEHSEAQSGSDERLDEYTLCAVYTLYKRRATNNANMISTCLRSIVELLQRPTLIAVHRGSKPTRERRRRCLRSAVRYNTAQTVLG